MHFIYSYILNTLWEKFHYKLLSGPCQSPASAPSNIIQRHLDLATTSRIETESRHNHGIMPRTCDHSDPLWLWWLSLPPNSHLILHSEAGPQPRLKTQPQSGLSRGHYTLCWLNIYCQCLWWEASSCPGELPPDGSGGRPEESAGRCIPVSGPAAQLNIPRLCIEAAGAGARPGRDAATGAGAGHSRGWRCWWWWPTPPKICQHCWDYEDLGGEWLKFVLGKVRW